MQRNNDTVEHAKDGKKQLDLDKSCLWKRRNDLERKMHNQHYCTKDKTPHTTQDTGPSHAVSTNVHWKSGLSRALQHMKKTAEAQAPLQFSN